MKCKCGNDIQIGMAAQVKYKGCKILTSMTTTITAECDKCGAKFQVPISSKDFLIKKD